MQADNEHYRAIIVILSFILGFIILASSPLSPLICSLIVLSWVSVVIYAHRFGEKITKPEDFYRYYVGAITISILISMLSLPLK